jgi:hypothetical protein
MEEHKQIGVRAFEGIKGRLPSTEQEFEDWLASHEGKAATVFELTSLSRVRETGRSVTVALSTGPGSAQSSGLPMRAGAPGSAG